MEKDHILAAKKLLKKFPNNLPIGYWIDGSNLIFLTKAINGTDKLSGSTLFIVNENDEIYGTNPMITPVDIKTMKKL